MYKVKSFFKLIRIHQIHKNIFVLLPLIFSRSFSDVNNVILAFLAALSFYSFSALVYIINDYKDIDSDKLHPIKKNRPLASGAISKEEAQFLIALFLLINSGIVLLWMSKPLVGVILTIFLVNNLFYNFKGKQIAYVDVIQNSFGYILRILAGSYAINIAPTIFLILVTFFLSFVLSIGKRIRELILFGPKARKSLKNYNFNFTKIIFLLSIIALNVIYLLYTIVTTEQNRLIILSFPLLAILSYRFYKIILFSIKQEDDPSLIFLKDKINILLMLITILLILFIVIRG